MRQSSVWKRRRILMQAVAGIFSSDKVAEHLQTMPGRMSAGFSGGQACRVAGMLDVAMHNQT